MIDEKEKFYAKMQFAKIIGVHFWEEFIYSITWFLCPRNCTVGLQKSTPVASVWSKTTLITGGVGGAGEDPLSWLLQ